MLSHRGADTAVKASCQCAVSAVNARADCFSNKPMVYKVLQRNAIALKAVKAGAD